MHDEPLQASRPTKSQKNRDLPLNRAIRQHWKTFLPRMYADLLANGELDERIDEAAAMTAEALSELLAKGMTYHQAWEMVANEWAFLPAESEEEHEQAEG